MTKAAKDDRAEQQKKYDAALAEARKLSAEADEAHANIDPPRRELLARLRSRQRRHMHWHVSQDAKDQYHLDVVSDLQAAREAAGARFRAAAEELHLAFVDLAALDHVLANGNIGGEQLATLGHPPDLWSLVHPVYAPFKPANWNDEIQATRDRYIAAATAQPEAPPPLIVHERK
jgi:hypothetical protein